VDPEQRQKEKPDDDARHDREDNGKGEIPDPFTDLAVVQLAQADDEKA